MKLIITLSVIKTRSGVTEEQFGVKVDSGTFLVLLGLFLDLLEVGVPLEPLIVTSDLLLTELNHELLPLGQRQGLDHRLVDLHTD